MSVHNRLRARLSHRLAGFVIFTVYLVAILPHLGGCTAPGAAGPVAQQNLANIQAQSANIRAVTASFHELVQAHAGAVQSAARERVAAALITVRAGILPDSPSSTDLADPAAPWTVALLDRAATLRARIELAPLDQRSAIADSLADEHPAEIDLAIATRGFDAPRILRDALALDSINLYIQAEISAPVRAALLARRDALLDAYAPARLAAAATTRALAAAQAISATLEEQTRIAELHAQSLAAFTSRPASDAPSTVLTTYHDPQLRAAILDLVRDTAGDFVATRFRDRITRLDAALTPLP